MLSEYYSIYGITIFTICLVTVGVLYGCLIRRQFVSCMFFIWFNMVNWLQVNALAYYGKDCLIRRQLVSCMV